MDVLKRHPWPLGLTLGSLGEHQQARQLQHDTLTHHRRVLGEDHSHVEG